MSKFLKLGHLIDTLKVLGYSPSKKFDWSILDHVFMVVVVVVIGMVLSATV